MREEWLMPGAVVPVDAETTSALVAEIKRLIGVVGGMALGMQPAPPRKPLTDEPTEAMLRAVSEQFDSDRAMGIGFNPQTLCRAMLNACNGIKE